MLSKTKSYYEKLNRKFKNMHFTFQELSKAAKTFLIIGLFGIVISLTALSFVIKDYIESKNSYTELQSLYNDKLSSEPPLTSVTAVALPIVATTTSKSAKKITELKKDTFDELQKINRDIKGWISIANTRVNYPILQAKDNEYYLERSYDRKVIINASIFMDFRNNPSEFNENTILYGHNMKDGSMFHDVINFKKKDFFNKNKIISIDTPNGSYNWEVFSVYVTDVKFDYLITQFSDKKEYSGFINTISNKSMFKSTVKVTSSDKILTLSTCSYEFKNARTVVHAKLLK